MKYVIKLSPYIDTQSDSEDVDVLNAENLEGDKKGMIYKRTGRAFTKYFNGITLTRVIRWDANGTQKWIAYDSESDKLIKFD
tara:strand:+ start:913 stop:1158 length:246 start_codon:yes stop_codon:yes gene_type:complete